MSINGRALKEHIETQAGVSFVERPSGWKGPCPFEDDKAGDSFIVFNLKDGEFFCLSCKAKGGLAEIKQALVESRSRQEQLAGGAQSQRDAFAEFKQILLEGKGERDKLERALQLDSGAIAAIKQLLADAGKENQKLEAEIKQL